MKSKNALSVLNAGGALALLFIGASAWAEVPYAQLETLRRFSIVTRVVLDQPEGPEAKQCRRSKDASSFISLGQKLELEIENAKADWGSLALLEADLPGLKKRISSCATRGSCQVYESFLSSVKADKAIEAERDALKADLEKKLSSLSSESFRKAWKSLPSPCALIRALDKK